MLHKSMKSKVHRFMFQVRITSVETGRCQAEFVVQPGDLNGVGGLHGGLIATIVDNYSTYALVANNCKPGVTIDLNVR